MAYNDFSVPCFCVKNDFYLLSEETTNGNRNCLKYCANDGHVCVMYENFSLVLYVEPHGANGLFFIKIPFSLFL